MVLCPARLATKIMKADFLFFLSLPPQVSNQVLVNQWHNLVQTLVATVIADKPVAEKASDAELCVIARRLTAVSFIHRSGNLGFYRKLSASLAKRFYQAKVSSTFVEHFLSMATNVENVYRAGLLSTLLKSLVGMLNANQFIPTEGVLFWENPRTDL